MGSPLYGVLKDAALVADDVKAVGFRIVRAAPRASWAGIRRSPPEAKFNADDSILRMVLNQSKAVLSDVIVELAIKRADAW